MPALLVGRVAAATPAVPTTAAAATPATASAISWSGSSLRPPGVSLTPTTLPARRCRSAAFLFEQCKPSAERTPAVIEVEAALNLKAENERLARQVASYDAAMRQLIERQFPLFDESVEITVTVGASAGEDLVVERHRTKPKPYLPYRVSRPITPPGTTPARYDDLALTCEVVSQDIGVALQPVLEPGNRLLILVFFQPGLRDSTEWALHYRAPGLFDELRATGAQSLRWSTSTLDNPSTPGIGEVTFYFDFLGIEDGATVGQERQTGDMKEDRLPGGARYTWHNFVPGRHEWTLRMPTHSR